MNSDTIFALIDKLRETRTLSDEELRKLYFTRSPETNAYLYSQADAVRRESYGNKVYLRGLIEISNICKNDCIASDGDFDCFIFYSQYLIENTLSGSGSG